MTASLAAKPPGPSGTTDARTTTSPTASDHLPLWALLLHDDDVNEMGEVCEILRQVTPLRLGSAFTVMLQAHREGVARVCETHQEHAELLAHRLRLRGLHVSLKPL